MKFNAELKILYFSSSDIVTTSEYQDDGKLDVPDRSTTVSTEDDDTLIK